MAWLIVGLGNPGPEYELTPHNMGFLAVDRLAERHGIRMSRPECQSLVGVGMVGRTEVILAKPQTYMNLSGGAVKCLLAKYGLKAAELLVVYDELALPWKQIRIRPGGSAAGHNGMKSVIASCGTESFARLRMGINPTEGRAGGKNFLLSPLRRGLEGDLDQLLDLSAEAMESITADGVEKSMAKYNAAPEAKKE